MAKTYYIVHATDNCPWCTKAKALLDYYEADYAVVYEKCPEWETYPAIYRVQDETPDLIGGFTELAAFSRQNGL